MRTIRRVGDDDWVLEVAWPPDLHPAWAGFRRRTETVLRREGVWVDMTRLDELTEAGVLGWWNAGVKTVEDLREKGSAAIAQHVELVAEQSAVARGLEQLAAEPWTARVWRRDPRFTDLLPRCDSTVRRIAVDGDLKDRRVLWSRAGELKARVEQVAVLPLAAAVAGYVEAISGQHGIRLEVLLARTGLGGGEPILLREAAASLGVSGERIRQIVGQLYRHLGRARPPAGIWLPQVDTAIRDGWPDGYTPAAVEATRRFFGR